MAIDGARDENVQPNNSYQPGHLLEDCIFLYSTADGNPAIRGENGSNFIQASEIFKQIAPIQLSSLVKIL